MQNNIIYSKRGGGYTSAINTSAMGGRATWPFAKLVLRQNNLTFTLLSNTIDLNYSDIKNIGVNKSGYVVIVANDPQKSFGFTGVDLDKIIAYLSSVNVATDDTVAANLNTAKRFVTGQVVFIFAFLILLLFFFLGFHHIGPLAHLKFRGQ